MPIVGYPMAGPIPTEVVAMFLGVDAQTLRVMFQSDMLPTLGVPSEKKQKNTPKIYFSMLLLWLNERATGRKWTAEPLEYELSKCYRKHQETLQARKSRKQKKETV